MIHLTEQCSVCGGGLIGYRLCSDHRTVVMMCDECEAVWSSDQDVKRVTPVFPKAPDFIVPGLGLSVGAPFSRWATEAEIATHADSPPSTPRG
jgi:hypothetical protein